MLNSSMGSTQDFERLLSQVAAHRWAPRVDSVYPLTDITWLRRLGGVPEAWSSRSRPGRRPSAALGHPGTNASCPTAWLPPLPVWHCWWTSSPFGASGSNRVYRGTPRCIDFSPPRRGGPAAGARRTAPYLRQDASASLRVDPERPGPRVTAMSVSLTRSAEPTGS